MKLIYALLSLLAPPCDRLIILHRAVRVTVTASPVMSETAM